MDNSLIPVDLGGRFEHTRIDIHSKLFPHVRFENNTNNKQNSKYTTNNKQNSKYILNTNVHHAYQDGSKKLRVPFVFYGNFEYILNQFRDVIVTLKKTFTQNINEYTPSVYGMYIKFAHGEYDGSLKRIMEKIVLRYFARH